MGPEYKNDCAGKGQQQFTGLDRNKHGITEDKLNIQRSKNVN
jgi:hypothetical protein